MSNLSLTSVFLSPEGGEHRLAVRRGNQATQTASYSANKKPTLTAGEIEVRKPQVTPVAGAWDQV